MNVVLTGPPLAAAIAETTAKLEVEIIRDQKGFMALEPVWDPLLERSGVETLFLTYEWLSTWWKHFGSIHRLFILVVRRGPNVVAILPLMATHREGFVQLGMIGNKISDYKDFIIDGSENRERIIRKILEALDLDESWDFLMLNGFPDDSVNSLPLFSILTQYPSSRVIRKESVPAPYIPLEGTFEDYFRNLKKSFREDTVRIQRKLEKKTLSHSFSDEIDPMRIGEIVDGIIDLNSSKYGRDGNNGCVFDNSLTRSFYIDFAKKVFPLGWLRIPTLSINGEVAGRFLDFQYKDKYYGIITSYKPEYCCYSPGRLIDMRQIRQCFERGLKEYDLLGGIETYKFNYNVKVRKMYTVYLFRDGWKGHLVRPWIVAARPFLERMTETHFRKLYWWYRGRVLRKG